MGSVWKAFGEASGAVQGCYWSVAGILCMEDIWNFWEVFGSGGEQLGGLGGGVRLLLMLMRCRCRALCMEDVWNFWEVFEGHFGSGGEQLGSVWGAYEELYGSIWEPFGNRLGSVTRLLLMLEHCRGL